MMVLLSVNSPDHKIIDISTILITTSHSGNHHSIHGRSQVLKVLHPIPTFFCVYSSSFVCLYVSIYIHRQYVISITVGDDHSQ